MSWALVQLIEAASRLILVAVSAQCTNVDEDEVILVTDQMDQLRYAIEHDKD